MSEELCLSNTEGEQKGGSCYVTLGPRFSIRRGRGGGWNLSPQFNYTGKGQPYDCIEKDNDLYVDL